MNVDELNKWIEKNQKCVDISLSGLVGPMKNVILVDDLRKLLEDMETMIEEAGDETD